MATNARIAQATAASSSSASSATKQSRGGKRKVQTAIGQEGDAALAQPTTEPRKKKAKKDPTEEKRLRKFRPKPPSNFLAVYERATTQRFFVIARTTPDASSACPTADFEISGSTGNIYHVRIARQPTCSCPHAAAGHQCKHTLFVLKRVLRARDALVWQLALLSSELREIFDGAPTPAGAGGGDDGDDDDDDNKGRKAVDGDCPICFEEMGAGAGAERLVWCRAACGQNIHKQCFDMWASTKRAAAGEVTCPYCRSGWAVEEEETVDLSAIRRSGVRNKDGYVNVADQLGISSRRDYSTYSRWWSGHPGYRGGW